MKALFLRIHDVTTHPPVVNNSDDESDDDFLERLLDENDREFRDFAIKELVCDDDDTTHFSVPIFSYIKPTTGLQLIHYIFLSLGSFATEVDIVMNETLRDAFRYTKLIGDSNKPEDLQRYSDELLFLWIEEQLQYFSNSKKVLTE